MTYRYKGRGIVQLTGKTLMSNHSNTINLGAVSQPVTSSNWPHISIAGQGAQGVVSITLGSGSNYGNIHSIEDLLGNTHFKKYEIYEFEEDILAISCAWKRQREDSPGEFRYSKLTDKKLFESVIPDDKEVARTIRDHYSKKIMMLKLKGRPLSSFRKDLNNFIHGDETRATEELFPLIYKLPEFYDYDVSVEEIKTLLEDRPSNVTLEKLHGKQSCFYLTPIKSVKKHNKRLKVIEYWFKEKSNTPVLIQLEPKNPLLHIWDDMFDSKKVLQISGFPFVKNMDDFEYLSIKNWKLAKI